MFFCADRVLYKIVSLFCDLRELLLNQVLLVLYHFTV